MLEIFNRQVEAAPENAKFYVQRGDLQSFIGLYEAAERDLLTAQKLNPAHPFVGKLLENNNILRREILGRNN